MRKPGATPQGTNRGKLQALKARNCLGRPKTSIFAMLLSRAFSASEMGMLNLGLAPAFAFRALGAETLRFHLLAIAMWY